MIRKSTLLVCGMALVGLVLSGCGAKQDTGQTADSSFDNLTTLAENVGTAIAAQQSTHFTMSIETAGQSLRGEGDMKLGAEPAMDMTLSVPSGDLAMVLVDDVFYVTLPTEAEPGKRWVKIDPNSDDPMSKMLGASLRQMKNNDPSQLLKQLEGAGEITGRRQEELGGKSTMHYSITVDVKKMAANQQDPDLKRLMEQAANTGVDSYPLEMWLDQENLPVRMTIDTPFTNPANQATERVKVTMDFSDWGKSVTVTAPPAEQVAELPG